MVPTIEYVISVGNILTIFAVVGSVMTFIWTMKGEIGIVRNDVRHLELGQKALAEAFTQLGKVLTSVAVQDTRITMIEKKIDELSHGRGYIDSRTG